MILPQLNPQRIVPLLRTGHFHTTRWCWMGCSFCCLAEPLTSRELSDAPPGLALTRIDQAVIDPQAVDRVKLHGGLSLREPFDYWLEAIRRIKRRVPRPLAAFSPVEIWQYHLRERRSIRDLLRALQWAGADMLGPGGSESLVASWSPYRPTGEEWLDIAASSLDLGLPVTAAVIVPPNPDARLAADYLAALKTVPVAALELKPLRGSGTRLAAWGDAHVLEVASVVQAFRDQTDLPLHVSLDGERPDAQLILSSAGADGFFTSAWEVSP